MEKHVRQVVFGALAGLAATMAMTAAMRRLHPLLHGEDRYPLPPREITERAGLHSGDTPVRTVLAHFGFGALTGALYAGSPFRRLGGVGYGLAVWAASYLGWIPAARILAPATRHPLERNLLMIAVHVVWGAALAASLRELNRSAEEVFSRPAGRLRPARERREMEPDR
ncbi:hypothetical protein [Kumtagia ephedrae]|uniref:DUF1440 domain-containing protein n=1 Tax=Kumtagia ephedrae TaxID=2116701 RepID=A0A2P7SL73_9HYPH|nr:hypothetical protein [Mesorhizobium ephedrae]PSJ63233.1 hypothetical protein C7I84_06205 [Mesorhizobium ephedrae]